MADNFTITPGTGLTIGSDEISTVHYQRIKLVWGADGSQSDVTQTNPLPIQIGNTVTPRNQEFQYVQNTPINAGVTGHSYKITGGVVYNSTGSTIYLKIFDDDSPTVGTTVPYMTIPCVSGITPLGPICGSQGIRTVTAWSIAATTGIADNNSGNPGATDLFVQLVMGLTP